MTGFTYRLVEGREEAKTMLQLCRGSFRIYYPKFDSWFSSRVISGLGSTRKILIASTQECPLVGICVLKNEEGEKKICSLRVDVRHRGQGVASSLLRKSVELLEDDKPLITVPAEVMPDLSPLLARMNFELSGVYRGAYRPDVDEFVYNGLLNPSVMSKRARNGHAFALAPLNS